MEDMVRQVRPKLPNNKKLAATRLSDLKKCLENDPRYMEHYVQLFME